MNFYIRPLELEAGFDESYAFFAFSNTPDRKCHSYHSCKVVTVPFTEGRISGGAGWIFPKRSPFLSIFNRYYWELKEGGHFDRIQSKFEYDPTKLLPGQECETLEEDPISMHKVISLFTMFFSCLFVTALVFW